MRFCWLISVVLFSLAGCSQKPAEVVEEAQKAAESWRETLRMTLQQWIDDRVPARYVKQIFKAGQNELGKELEGLQKVPAGQAGREQVIKQLSALQEWAEKNLGNLSQADHKKRQEMLA